VVPAEVTGICAGPRALAVLINFNLVCVCWIFFRAESLTRATEVLHAVFQPAPHAISLTALMDSNLDAAIGAGAGLTVLALHAILWERWIPKVRGSWPSMAAYVPTLILVMIAFGRWAVQGFIYFQF
jgi:hypothetical protein